MSNNRRDHWFDRANPEEKGSFCDRESEEEFENMDAFSAEQAARTAEGAGDKVNFWQASVSDNPDTRYNRNICEADGDDEDDYQHARYRPGR